MTVRIHNFNKYYFVNLNILNDIFIKTFNGIPKVIDKKFNINLDNFKYSNFVLTANLYSNELSDIELNSIIDSIKIIPIMNDFTSNKDDTISVNIKEFDIIYFYMDKCKLRDDKLRKITSNIINKQKL